MKLKKWVRKTLILISCLAFFFLGADSSNLLLMVLINLGAIGVIAVSTYLLNRY